MIVCHCAVVNDKAIVAAAEKGAVTLASMCSRTGAGQDCGGCVFAVRRIMCEHLETITPSLEVLDATG